MILVLLQIWENMTVFCYAVQFDGICMYSIYQTEYYK